MCKAWENTCHVTLFPPSHQFCSEDRQFNPNPSQFVHQVILYIQCLFPTLLPGCVMWGMLRSSSPWQLREMSISLLQETVFCQPVIGLFG